MAVCCQYLTLGALNSRSALSLLVGALFKTIDLFLITPCIWSRHVVQEWCGASTFAQSPLNENGNGCAMRAMSIQTCDNPVTIGYNLLVAVAFATRLNHKLPFLFDSPSYNLWSE
jgi:hypothetical protein